MDPKDQLRRFLEQRREAGETELVLDSLDVDDVLQLIGVKGRTAPDPSVTTVAADWRTVLRGSETGPVPPTRVSESPAPMQGPGSRYAFGEPAPVDETNRAAESAPTAESHATLPFDRIPTGYVVGPVTRELFGGAAPAFASLDDVVRAVAACDKCALAQGAKNPVPGEGSPTAGLVCVGEAPGATEDDLGRPFVGPAGQLLTKILAAIQLTREDVYICNVLKHRPPGNRNPMPSEVEACSPYLVRQIELIRPKVIVAFGTFAAQTLLNTKDAIGKLRGRLHRYHGVPLVVTYHPAALLRNPGWKRPTWDDVKLARRLLDRVAGV